MARIRLTCMILAHIISRSGRVEIPLRLRTLGGLSVDLVSASDGAATRRRPLALLALLAVAGSRGVSRDKIVAYLWPESDDERARNSLSQALTSLKREL